MMKNIILFTLFLLPFGLIAQTNFFRGKSVAVIGMKNEVIQPQFMEHFNISLGDVPILDEDNIKMGVFFLNFDHSGFRYKNTKNSVFEAKTWSAGPRFYALVRDSSHKINLEFTYDYSYNFHYKESLDSKEEGADYTLREWHSSRTLPIRQSFSSKLSWGIVGFQLKYNLDLFLNSNFTDEASHKPYQDFVRGGYWEFGVLLLL